MMGKPMSKDISDTTTSTEESSQFRFSQDFAAEIVDSYRSNYQNLSQKITDFTLERLYLESQKWSANTREQLVRIRERIWTINDALLSLEQRRSEAEYSLKALFRLQHQARRIESDLAENGLYNREIKAAESCITEWFNRRGRDLLKLNEITRQIAVIAQTAAAQNGQPEKQNSQTESSHSE